MKVSFKNSSSAQQCSFTALQSIPPSARQAVIKNRTAAKAGRALRPQEQADSGEACPQAAPRKGEGSPPGHARPAAATASLPAQTRTQLAYLQRWSPRLLEALPGPCPAGKRPRSVGRSSPAAGPATLPARKSCRDRSRPRARLGTREKAALTSQSRFAAAAFLGPFLTAPRGRGPRSSDIAGAAAEARAGRARLRPPARPPLPWGRSGFFSPP